tara:strand:+ start:749 stop:1009 length:261 start_codon:yes stop_codon:yes gene_type:complete
MSKLDISYNNYELNLKHNDDTKNLKENVNLSSNSSISFEFDLNIHDLFNNSNDIDEKNLINDYYYCINNKASNLRYKNNIRNLFKI